MHWIGVDVGGTFTDLVVYDTEACALSILKTPSTPQDQSIAVLKGIAQVGIDPGDIARFGHGSTVATNTALERTGARMAVVATQGHRDVLIVGRGNRTVIYNIKARQPEPIVRRDDCFEVVERMGAGGEVLVPLDEAQVGAIAARLKQEGFEAVAVCFLHSYANPAHEQRVAARLRAALPEAAVVASHEVIPEYREQERFFTTALNAYIAPRMRRYLGGLRRRLADVGATAEVAIMTSNGGALPDRRIEALPVLSMQSGPAAGVIAARFLGQAAGFANVITYDMGGTSTDVCVIRNGRYGMTALGKVGAFPIKLQQIDINSVGAGGGSIASIGAGGVLTVGPRSAGAVPGPACYGRGGRDLTVTDCNVALGRLGTDEPLGGEIELDRAAAEAAVDALAARLRIDRLATAEGVLRIAVANMTAAIKEISVMRGLDPRDFALLAYGGAGPLHAAAIAEELGIKTVIVPPMPGNFSALGLLVADIRRDFVQTRIAATRQTAPAAVRGVFADLKTDADKELCEAGVVAGRRSYDASLDMRYLGQAFELSVPIPFDVADMLQIDAAFRAVYAARYGHAVDGPTEIVNYRLAAWGITDKPDWPQITGAGRSLKTARTGTRPVVFAGRVAETPVLLRAALPVDAGVVGPAIIEEPGSSTVVPERWTARLEPMGSLILERGP
jgi:N-methylhydantoinase A